MKILCVSDIHGDLPALCRIFEREQSADLVILAGDITDRGTVDQAERIVARARAFSPNLAAVAGNCDSSLIDQMLQRQGVGLHAQTRDFHNLRLLGLSGVSSRRFGQYAFREEDFTRILTDASTPAPETPLILVTHSPPRGLVDRTNIGLKAGSHAIRAWVEIHAPKLVVCGHIHEAQGHAQLGPTHIVNCGPAYKHRYATVHLDHDETHVEIHRFKP